MLTVITAEQLYSTTAFYSLYGIISYWPGNGLCFCASTFLTMDFSCPLTNYHKTCTQVWCGVKP